MRGRTKALLECRKTIVVLPVKDNFALKPRFERLYLGRMCLSRSVDLDVEPTGVLRTELPLAGAGNRIIHLAALVARARYEIIDTKRRFGFLPSFPTISDPRVDGILDWRKLQRLNYKGPTLNADDAIRPLRRLKRFPFQYQTQWASTEGRAVVFHVRLGDFHAWRPGAIMNKSFFTRAAIALGSIGQNEIFIISDEPKSAFIRELEDELCHFGIPSRIVFGSVQDHLSLLCFAKWVVASPSSFSLCGAWMGKQRIVWQREWAEKSAAGGSEFWQAACENSVPFLDVTLI